MRGGKAESGFRRGEQKGELAVIRQKGGRRVEDAETVARYEGRKVGVVVADVETNTEAPGFRGVVGFAGKWYYVSKAKQKRATHEP